MGGRYRTLAPSGAWDVTCQPRAALRRRSSHSEIDPPTGATIYSETGVPTFSGSLTAAAASTALSDMLYYTQSVVAVSGSTTTSNT
jgi:hypothetical protein